MNSWQTKPTHFAYNYEMGSSQVFSLHIIELWCVIYYLSKYICLLFSIWVIYVCGNVKVQRATYSKIFVNS